MKKLFRIAFAPFVVSCAMGLLAGCSGGGEPATPAETPKPADAAKPAETPKPADAAPTPAPAGMEVQKPADAAPASTPAAPAAEPAATPAATPAAPAAGAALDAKTIVGTKWSAIGYTLLFEDNGIVKINDDAEGTWKLDGNKLTIEANGTPYEATIEGDKIMYEGTPLEKL